MFMKTVQLSVGPAPTLEYCNLHPEKLNKEVFRRFYDDLNKDRKKDMTFFFNNLETIKIVDVPKSKGITSNAGAQYEMVGNVIEIIDKNMFDSYIDHELLHMASSIKDEEGNTYSGFIQGRGEYGIGYGIDEGYTALLDDRYFIHRTPYKEKYNYRTYQVVKFLATRVEEFISREKMEDLYFTADLLSLIETLEKYTSEAETMQFIHNIDEILLTFEQARIKNIPLCYKRYADCMLFICEAWLYRIDEGYINGNLTKKEYEYCLNMVKHMFNSRIGLKYIPFQSYDISKYYPQIENKVVKKLAKKYGEKEKIRLSHTN